MGIRSPGNLEWNPKIVVPTTCDYASWGFSYNTDMGWGALVGTQSIGERGDLECLARMFSGVKSHQAQMWAVTEWVNGLVPVSRIWSYTDQEVLRWSRLK